MLNIERFERKALEWRQALDSPTITAAKGLQRHACQRRKVVNGRSPECQVPQFHSLERRQILNPGKAGREILERHTRERRKITDVVGPQIKFLKGQSCERRKVFERTILIRRPARTVQDLQMLEG